MNKKVVNANRLFLIVLLTFQIGGTLLLLLLQELGVDIRNNLLLNALISQSLVVLPTIIYLIINKVNVKKELRLKPLGLNNCILTCIFAFVSLPVLTFMNMVSMLFAKNYMSAGMLEAAESQSVFVMLFVMALIPCFVEELLYRGVLFGTYRKVSIFGGMLLSGFLFGIMHGNINQFMYAAVMGIVLALLVEATGSLWSSVIVHFIINGISVVLTNLLPTMIKFLEQYMPQEYSEELLEQATNTTVSRNDLLAMFPRQAIMAIVACVLGFVVLRAIAKNAGRWDHMKNIFKKDAADIDVNEDDEIETVSGSKNLFSVSLLVGIAFCIVIMIARELW